GPGAPVVFVEGASVHVRRDVEPTRGARGWTRAERAEGDLPRVDVVHERGPVRVEEGSDEVRAGLRGDIVRDGGGPRSARGGGGEDQEGEEDGEPAALVGHTASRRALTNRRAR